MKFHLVSTCCLLVITSIASAAGPADLIRLYEEEILAHDLYVALGSLHPQVMPLQNIPKSEMRHREAMAAILKAEGIELPKPVEGRRFATDGLDETYAKWLAEGEESDAGACHVGVRLEDHDIADLRQAQVDFPKHQKVLAQLEAASNNHLRAFHRNLASRGGEYTPEALSEEDLESILSGEHQSCGACNDACSPKAAPTGKAKGKGKAKSTGKASGKAMSRHGRGGR